MSLALSTLLYEWRRYMAAIVALAFSGLLVLAQVGMFMGIARQNLMAMAVAMGCAFAVILGPGILAGIVTGSAAPIELAGTIDATPEALPAVLVN